jgi:hypothetical protein
MRRMSRYLRLRAEHVRITPLGVWVVGVVEGVWVVGWERRVAIASSRSRISQSQRSASVRGSPRAILATLAGVWYYGRPWVLVVSGITVSWDLIVSMSF